MDLDIVRVIRSIPPAHEPLVLAQLTTPFGEAQAAEQALAQAEASHPRPSFARARWTSLNGLWNCAFVSEPQAKDAWRTAEAPSEGWQDIRVPFSPEASLSGVSRQLQPGELLWYRRELPPVECAPDERVILHFDGVDYACALYVNGHRMGEHKGAYLPFCCDITDALRDGADASADESERTSTDAPASAAELALCVFDPSETGTQLRGKQRLDRGDMWYTAQSGIWQDVWIETVPADHIANARLLPDADAHKLGVRATLATRRLEGNAPLVVSLWDEDELLASHEYFPMPPADIAEATAQELIVAFAFDVPAPVLWTPTTPKLYRVTLDFGSDHVESYCAFRSVGIEEDERGVRRFCLNHQPLFLRGLLDQGYWPDGLLTPPSEEAMTFDIQTAQDAGFNLLRKHIKVESDRWYWLCDRMGMLVWQDMPSGGSELDTRLTRDLPTLFRHSWAARRDDTPKGREALAAGDASYRNEWLATCENVIERLSGHPCVVGWTLFNESWGQFDAVRVTEFAQALDHTRPILSTSGWYDQGAGDVQGIHNYFRKMHLFPDTYAKRSGVKRAQLLSEFGGLTLRIEGHSCIDRIYGYSAFEDAASWKAGLEELLAQVDALEAEGLSGFVYTQLTDVEEETNGILTYDRRINKLTDL
jgi:beta-galactosidase/beta-glucuronidase